MHKINRIGLLITLFTQTMILGTTTDLQTIKMSNEKKLTPYYTTSKDLIKKPTNQENNEQSHLIKITDKNTRENTENDTSFDCCSLECGFGVLAVVACCPIITLCLCMKAAVENNDGNDIIVIN